MGTKLFNRVAAIVVRDGAVLTHEALDESGAAYQALPGGHLEPDETAEDCLIRELGEEFDVRIRVGRLVYVAEGFFAKRRKRLHEVVLYFIAELEQPAATVRSRERHLTARWLPLDGGLVRLFPAWLRDDLPRDAKRGWSEGVRYVVARD